MLRHMSGQCHKSPDCKPPKTVTSTLNLASGIDDGARCRDRFPPKQHAAPETVMRMVMPEIEELFPYLGRLKDKHAAGQVSPRRQPRRRGRGYVPAE
jgi:hypothetical protein